jgi:hypothetical protein
MDASKKFGLEANAQTTHESSPESRNKGWDKATNTRFMKKLSGD